MRAFNAFLLISAAPILQFVDFSPVRKKIPEIVRNRFKSEPVLARAKEAWRELCDEDRVLARMNHLEEFHEGRAHPHFLVPSAVLYRNFYVTHVRPAVTEFALHFAKHLNLDVEQTGEFLKVADNRDEIDRLDAGESLAVHPTCGELRAVFRSARRALAKRQLQEFFPFAEFTKEEVSELKAKLVEREKQFASRSAKSPSPIAYSDLFEDIGHAALVHSVDMARLVGSNHSNKYRDMSFYLTLRLFEKLEK